MNDQCQYVEPQILLATVDLYGYCDVDSILRCDVKLLCLVTDSYIHHQCIEKDSAVNGFDLVIVIVY